MSIIRPSTEAKNSDMLKDFGIGKFPKLLQKFCQRFSANSESSFQRFYGEHGENGSQLNLRAQQQQ